MDGPDGIKEGFIIDILEETGIDYEIVSPEDKRYGYYDEKTKKWNGMIGMIVDGVSI